MYVPSFFPFDSQIVGQKRGSITYGTDREDEVSTEDIYYFSIVCLTGSGTILFMGNGFEFLKQFESKTSQFEIVLSR